jgi:hypothetical protein
VNDPHVVSLKYRVKTAEHVEYLNPPAVVVETPDYRLRLDGGTLVAEMRAHYATAESARTSISEALRAWELSAELEYGPASLSFLFESADMIDRKPPAGSPRVHDKALVSELPLAGTLTGRVFRAKYPQPLTRFKPSPLVELLMLRQRLYAEGKESLASMGYVCLTALEHDAAPGGNKARQAVAAKYAIDAAVLSKLGELTSIVGDDAAARKFDKQSARRPHTGAERTWVEAVVKKLARRVAEHAYDPTAPLQQITMKDLPPL